MVEMHEISKNGNGQIIRLDTCALTVLAPQSTKNQFVLLLHGQSMVIFAILIDLKTEDLLF